MIYEFAGFELDTELYELRRGGQQCKLEPQVFDLLRYLVENRGRLVTRQELLDAVWSDRFVSEATLSSRLMAARKAVGDDGRRQQVIKTMHGRGFRFVAEVGQQGVIVLPAPPPVPLATDAQAPKPETRYARSGSVNLAYQVIGSGPVDIVFVMGWVSHLEMFWTERSFAQFLRRISEFSRLILFDKRGTGLSDRVPLTDLPTLEQRMDDVRAVMQAAGSRRAVLMGVSEGAPMCALFAATYPENAAGMILIGGYARRTRTEDYPWGDSPAERAEFVQKVGREWGGPVGLEARAPGRAADPQFREWWATYLRMGASPGAVTALMKMNDQIDVRAVLPTIRVPTLVIHRRDEKTCTIEHGRYLAANIPGAEMLELPGDDHLPFVGDQEEILGPVERFVGSIRADSVPERVLSTILVASLEDDQQSRVRREVEWFHGRLQREGLPAVATFDGPVRAVRCALALASQGAAVAIHTGECRLTSSGVSGPAASAAQALGERAVAGEVLVSSATRALVAGSDLSFVPAEGRSVDGIREVFAATP